MTSSTADRSGRSTASARKGVAVTGGLAGLGRAVCAFAGAAGDVEGCSPAARTGCRRGWPTSPRPAGGRSVRDVADHRADAAADQIEDRMGPIEVNNAMTSIFAPFWTPTRRTSSARPRQTYRIRERTRASHRRRRDRGCSSRWARRWRTADPGAVGVLREQARDGRLHRERDHRAAARPQQGVGGDGAHAGAEHHPVQLGEVAAAAPPAAGAAHLPAGSVP